LTLMDYLHPPLQCVCWVRLSQSLYIQLSSFAVDNTIIAVEIIHNSTWAVLLVKSLYTIHSHKSS
jgi:hypothetical protein